MPFRPAADGLFPFGVFPPGVPGLRDAASVAQQRRSHRAEGAYGTGRCSLLQGLVLEVHGLGAVSEGIAHGVRLNGRHVDFLHDVGRGLDLGSAPDAQVDTIGGHRCALRRFQAAGGESRSVTKTPRRKPYGFDSRPSTSTPAQ